MIITIKSCIINSFQLNKSIFKLQNSYSLAFKYTICISILIIAYLVVLQHKNKKKQTKFIESIDPVNTLPNEKIELIYDTLKPTNSSTKIQFRSKNYPNQIKNVPSIQPIPIMIPHLPRAPRIQFITPKNQKINLNTKILRKTLPSDNIQKSKKIEKVDGTKYSSSVYQSDVDGSEPEWKDTVYNKNLKKFCHPDLANEPITFIANENESTPKRIEELKRIDSKIKTRNLLDGLNDLNLGISDSESCSNNEIITIGKIVVDEMKQKISKEDVQKKFKDTVKNIAKGAKDSSEKHIIESNTDEKDNSFDNIAKKVAMTVIGNDSDDLLTNKKRKIASNPISIENFPINPQLIDYLNKYPPPSGNNQNIMMRIHNNNGIWSNSNMDIGINNLNPLVPHPYNESYNKNSVSLNKPLGFFNNTTYNHHPSIWRSN